MKTSTLSLFALALASTGLTSLPAAAQDDLQRGETVLERRRPEVEQLGLRAGSFLFLPRLEAGTTYDSNVYATRDNHEDDFIWTVRPRLDIKSDFSAHALNFSASADAGRYSDHPSENYTDYALQADGRFDVNRGGALDGQLFHRRNHEGRGDINSFAGYTEPVTYRTSGGEVGYTQRFNRVRARVSGSAQYADYDDVGLIGGGVAPQGDRNRWEYATVGRVGYEFLDGYETFIQGTYSWTRHQNERDVAGINRDSDGYEVVGGIATDLTGLVTGELFAGYLVRNYDDSRLEDFNGISFGGRLNWAVTQLTAISASASRQVRETSSSPGLGSASSYTRTLLAVGVDHELLRTLVLNGRMQYRMDDFNGENRNDKVYTASVGGTYQMNRYLFLTGGYTYEKRNSNLNAADYSDNLIYLRVGAQM
ncbi:outer membrane beta-barrel protein [Azospirillum picis]|uniref:Outer membrane beta-barrel protein n=1 Tax=Azospirillum picis TaxID=488438 RepID=A0ABU0MQY9_9PROT|nr:outer membrane beta-barrel protein [Azospirillum picis]MBP2302309.1 hypothetical protein [Azospirillum picis]MDQ0535888.1 hypothetical protein [Azospirillum picis]